MPWGRLDDSLYDHPKLDLIPEDERLAAIGLWARAISWCNRFLTDGLVPRDRIAKLDGTVDLADRLVVAGLFDADKDVPSGAFKIHDFLHFNESRAKVLERRKSDADRKAKWRADRDAQKGTKAPKSARHSGTSRTKGADVPPSVTPSVRSDATPESQVESRRDSRTHESRPDPTRPDPDSLERDSPERVTTRRRVRADVDALHDRGWKRVTPAQRKVLDEVLGRHDVTGPEFAAEVIRATPADRDPLAEVMAADAAWQARRRREVDAESRSWEAAKGSELATAGSVLKALLRETEDVPA